MVYIPVMLQTYKFSLFIGTDPDLHEEGRPFGRPDDVLLHVEPHVDRSAGGYYAGPEEGFVGGRHLVAESRPHVVLYNPYLRRRNTQPPGYHHCVPVYADALRLQGKTPLFVPVTEAAVSLDGHVRLP